MRKIWYNISIFPRGNDELEKIRLPFLKFKKWGQTFLQNTIFLKKHFIQKCEIYFEM